MKKQYTYYKWIFSTLPLIFLLIITPLTNLEAQFAKGADISWISEMESSGYRWYNDQGIQQDLYQILKDHGMNAIRLRVWVDPSGGWCNLNDMLYKAQRARNAGMDILLTIHYSDTWADPGHQTKPGWWTNLSTQGLYDRVYSYTYEVISTMVANNVTPKWVQIGNETNDGMLWENGRASSNMQVYSWLVNSGHNAVKAVNSNIKTIVHLSNGYDNALFQWNIGGVISNGANFDIIGMSLYPVPENWQTLNNQCLANMQDMKSRYGKDVMICEIGMRADYPQTAKNFIEDIISKTQSVGGLGVFYWEPEVYNGWKGYGKGAWQENGRPSIALDGFLGGNNGNSTIISVRALGTSGSEHITLKVGGTSIAGWTLGTSYQTFSATTSMTGTITVNFDNDANGRDVRVDYIQINGTTSQAESQYPNTGVWQNSSCGGSYSEWMHCNGSITFGSTSSRVTTIEDTSLDGMKLCAYPNPVSSGALNISGLIGPSRVHLLDLSGNLLKEIYTESNELTMGLDVTSGTYVVRVRNSQGSSNLKILVK